MPGGQGGRGVFSDGGGRKVSKAAPVGRFTSAASGEKSKGAWMDCNGETDSAVEVDVRGIRMSAPISEGKSEK